MNFYKTRREESFGPQDMLINETVQRFADKGETRMHDSGPRFQIVGPRLTDPAPSKRKRLGALNQAVYRNVDRGARRRIAKSVQRRGSATIADLACGFCHSLTSDCTCLDREGKPLDWGAVG